MKYLFLLLSLPGFSLLAQPEIKWSDFASDQGLLYEIYPIQDSSFYTIHYKPLASVRADTAFYLKYYQDFKIAQSVEINRKVNGNAAKVESVRLMNGSIYVFLSFILGDEKILYVQNYPQPGLIPSPCKELAKYTIPNKLTRKGDFSISLSENKEFVGVSAYIPGSKKENPKLSCKVFTKNFGPVSSQEQVLSYANDEIRFLAAHQSNTGDLFMLLRQAKKAEGLKIIPEDEAAEKLVLLKSDGKDLLSSEIAFSTPKFLSGIRFVENKNQLVFSALHSDKNDGTSAGIFLFRYDFANKKIASEQFIDYHPEMFRSAWIGILNVRDLIPHEYKIRESLFMADGSLLLTLEQSYRKVESMNTNGNNSIFHVCNDIILFKIDPSGTILWKTKVEKHQKTHNDHGVYSSFVTAVKDKQLLIYFNDNVGNYDTEGNFFQCQSIADPMGESNGFVQAEINLANGEQKRSICYKKSARGAVTIPLKSESVTSKNQIILYLVHDNKEKYGLFQY
ncbi:MAG: hypothetical protein K0R65_487 [Crocinitomicaceae bacterium]|jgi:hypothetical protein|nr:hypothetical protein [Crocinitomicaceae bacterium]